MVSLHRYPKNLQERVKLTVNERLRREIEQRDAVITAMVINETLNRARLDDLEARVQALDGKTAPVGEQLAKRAQEIQKKAEHV